jgi:hypothetical protein
MLTARKVLLMGGITATFPEFTRLILPNIQAPASPKNKGKTAENKIFLNNSRFMVFNACKRIIKNYAYQK